MKIGRGTDSSRINIEVTTSGGAGAAKEKFLLAAGVRKDGNVRNLSADRSTPLWRPERIANPFCPETIWSKGTSVTRGNYKAEATTLSRREARSTRPVYFVYNPRIVIRL